MSDYITAAEATTILRDLARGREDGDGGDVWPLYDRAEDAMQQVIALDLAATLLESERAAERTRADAAEAELARLTTERDAARAEAAGLRAVVEGRPAPTDAEVAAHDAAGGLWIVGSGGELNPWVSAAGVRYHRARVERYGEPLWFLALSAERRPCPWPTVAAEAATALAGEGR